MITEKPPGSENRIASMTGYGRAAGASATGRVSVEARSLNHRFLEVFVRAPRTIMCLEPEIRALVKDRISRGKVEVFISLEGRLSVRIDLDRALEIAGALQEIAGPLGDKVRLEHVLAAGEVTAAMEQEVTPEWRDMILEAAENALDSLVDHRLVEGKSLAEDVMERMEDLHLTVERIEALAPQVADRVRRQISEFLAGVDLGDLVDPQRLEVETALLSQKSDITEEITRLKTHLSAFKGAFSSGGVVGRRMDFLVQEMQREINTIGSKSGLTEISRMVVDFKAGLEKVREQVQNIE